MPLQSREVVNCRLIFDCDAEWDDYDFSDQPRPRPRDCSTILCLPSEARLQICRYLLRFDHCREPHSRPVPDGGIDHLLKLDSRRILEAPQFKHKSKQEINGVLPLTHTCHLHPAILRTCSALYLEARTVLYVENKVFAVQCGISGLGSRLRNYGVPTFGPIESSRLVGIKDKADEDEDGKSGPRRILAGSFDPVILFKGHKSKPTCPYYVCSHLDGTQLLHALWIMIKCPFARSMRFSVHLTSSPKFHSLSLTDKFVRGGLLPWMHNHVDMITMDDMNDPRIVLLKDCLATHRNASEAEANVYTYNTVCHFLEHVKDHADKAVDMGHFISAEELYERICYEACSIVRTRTGKLVDVSTKTHDGINRVCKLIAISAFRLCELRSGAIKIFRRYKKSHAATPCASPKSEMPEEQVFETSSINKPLQPTSPTVRLRKLNEASKAQTQRHSHAGTTRLRGTMAIEHAIMAGLLALRLPCATPVTEWNIRLNLMLLFLFIRYDDLDNALSCIRRLHTNCDVLLKEAKSKNKKGDKWDSLDTLVEVLGTQKNLRKAARDRRREYQLVVEQCQDCVRRLWGERLNPRKGYIGLIWTFRWA